jgi:hypothetical protein
MNLRTVWAIIISIFASSTVFAGTFSASVISTLPAKVQKLKLHQTTVKDAETLLGKADLTEDSNYYWELGGIKYSLSLTFKKDVLASYQFHYFETRPQLSAFKIPEKDLKVIYQPARPSEKAARLYEKDGVTLEFSPRSDELQSAEFK